MTRHEHLGGAHSKELVWSETILVAAVSAVLGVFLVVWLDNAHLSTSNGLWKSFQVEPWKADLATASLDPSNYLYFPIMGALCGVLDRFAIFPGHTWRQMALIDSLFAGVAVAAVYWMVRRLTGRRDLAMLAAVIHFGSAGFLSLALSNEDIMPSYTFLLIAMAMAGVWFSGPTPIQIVLVATMYTLGWLGEWRLIFPAFPPLVAALALSKGPPLLAAGRILLFISAVLAVAFLAAAATRGHLGSQTLVGLLWTGKGVDTGYANFSIEKLLWIPFGMGEYLLGGRPAPERDTYVVEWTLAFALELALFAAFAIVMLRRIRDARLRNIGVIFLGTLVTGQVMNAYSQPADPQMQLNVMAWLPISVIFLVNECSRKETLRLSTFALASCSALFIIVYNVHAFALMRGLDSKSLAEVHGLNQLVDSDLTVFLYAGWEPITTWQFREGDRRWDGVCNLPNAPLREPKFKWITLYSPVVRNQALSADQYAANIKGQLECAFSKGYRVVAGSVWLQSVEEFRRELSLLNRTDLATVAYELVHSYANRSLGKPTPDAAYDLQELRPTKHRYQ